MKFSNNLSIKKSVYFLITFSTIIISLASCKKNDSTPVPTPPAIPAPVINTINPNHGPFNTSLIVTGSNFSTTASQNVVKVNGVLVTVTNATATQLTVNIPVGAGTGNVLVKVNGSEVSGPVFTYDYTAIVSTVAGDPTSAVFFYPSGVTVDDQDNIYVSDLTANQIKKISPAGAVSVLAGNGGQGGFIDGVGTGAKFNYPWALKCDGQGNIYVCDMNNNSIRKVTAAGVVTTFAGNGIAGYVEGQGTFAQFNHPTCITFDAPGNIYIADSYNGKVRKITASGMVSTMRYNSIPVGASHGLLMDPLGNIFSCIQGNNIVTKYRTDGGWTEYGNGTAGLYDGHYTVARFNAPSDIIADGQGNMYVADASNGAIRKIDVNGYITTIAGNGTLGYADGIGSAAMFQYPRGIAIDKHGNLLVADASNRVIRKIVFQ